jgi:glycogen debranching enzyme
VPSASLVVSSRGALAEAGLGHVSEIFEGDAPHCPCGCIAQAWGVAEIPRVYLEDVRDLRPNCDRVAAQPSPRIGYSIWGSLLRRIFTDLQARLLRQQQSFSIHGRLFGVL